MLTKLFKYELKSTARLLLPLFVAVIIFSIINRFLFPWKVSQPGFLYAIVAAITMITYVVLMVGMFVMTLVIMIQRFYKNLLGDEGYLMFTLPLSTRSHIISKLLIAMLWVFASCIIAFISILIISKQTIPFSDLFMAIRSMESEIGMNGYLLILEILSLMLLGLAANILLVYGAISLGHIFNKHKVIASFAMYIVLNVICQILIVLFMYVADKLFHFSEMSTPSNIEIQRLFLISFIYAILINGGSFILTEFILKKKLNLE